MKNNYILTPYYLDETSPRLENLVQTGWFVNKATLPDGEKQSRMSVLHLTLADRVAENIGSGHRPISIAGDCCTVIAVTAGLQRAGIDPFLLWLDAHGDFNTWETTPSGFLGGMPLAMLVGRGEQTMVTAAQMNTIDEDRVLLTDGRDLDPGEDLAINDSSIHHLRNVMDVTNFNFPAQPLYVHFDTDVINPEETPAQNYPAQGGPSVKDVEEVFRFLARSGKVVAISLSSWNPDLVGGHITQQVCMHLLDILAGE